MTSDSLKALAALARSWSSRTIPRCASSLKLFLKDEGHRAATAPDGIAALELVAARRRSGLISSLPTTICRTAWTGFKLTAKLREKLASPDPGHHSHRRYIDRHPARYRASGLCSAQQAGEVEGADASHPTSPADVASRGTRALAPHPADAAGSSGPPSQSSSSMTTATCARRFAACSKDDGRIVEDYATCEAFLEAYRPGREACLLIDAYLPGMSGLELLQRLSDAGHRLPAIMITGNSDVPMAVQAMKAGASDFIEKPIGRDELLASVERALEQSRDSSKLSAWRDDAARSHREPHAATAPDHGAGPRRPPQQEYRRGSWHQPAHGREPSRLDHEENRLEVSAGSGPAGARRRMEDRGRAIVRPTGALATSTIR